MMYSMLRVAGILVLVLISTVIFISQKTLLNFPYNQIHVIFIILTFLLFFAPLSASMWYSVIVAFILELYAITPFGLLTCALIASAIIGHTMFQRFLTNFSFVSLTVTLLVILLSNRIIVLCLNILAQGSFKDVALFPELVHLFWEFIMSTGVLLPIYFLVRHFYRMARPEYVRR